MKTKIYLILVVMALMGGSFYAGYVSHIPEKIEKPKSDFFKNTLKDIDTNDGESF